MKSSRCPLSNSGGIRVWGGSRGCGILLKSDFIEVRSAFSDGLARNRNFRRLLYLRCKVLHLRRILRFARATQPRYGCPGQSGRQQPSLAMKTTKPRDEYERRLGLHHHAALLYCRLWVRFPTPHGSATGAWRNCGDSRDFQSSAYVSIPIEKSPAPDGWWFTVPAVCPKMETGR